jgi:hypothetical protein
MTTKEFIPLLNNPELGETMSGAQSPQEAYDIAKANGLTDSFEEFVEEMTKLKETVGELSEADLESVAGGDAARDFEVVTAILTSVSATGTSVGMTVVSAALAAI